MPFSRPVEGRKALASLIVLALLGSGLLWRLTRSERSSSPGRPDPEANRLEDQPTPRLGVAVPEGSEIRSARIEPTGRLLVRLIVLQGGEPLPVERVDIRNAAGATVASLELTPRIPMAELECLPGDYELELQPAPELDSLRRHVTLRPGVTESVDFSLPTAARLLGRLVDEDGQRIEGVTIALELDGRVVSEARTRPDGGFVLPPLPEGEYALVVGDPLGPLVERRTLRLTAGLGQQEVLVPALLELDVRVVDEMGLAVAGAEVEGVGEQGGRVAGVTDLEGKLRAAMLPPGNYRIFARHPDVGRGNQILVLGEP